MNIFKSRFWAALALGLSLTIPCASYAQPSSADGKTAVRKASVVCEGRNDPQERMHIFSLMRDVEKARGLKFNDNIRCNFCSLKDAGNYLIDVNKKYADKKVNFRRNEFFHHLLLLNKDQIFEKCSDLLYSDQVRGLYDIINKVMLVVTDVVEEPGLDKRIKKILDHFNIDLNDVFLIHELCHALQDQNFNLGDSLLKADGNLDRELAALSAAEGDAVQSMFEYLAQSVGISSSLITDYVFASPGKIKNLINQYPQLKNSPLIVRSLALMPYFDGLSFRNTVYEQQGINGVNNTFKNVPVSTEHVLHPLKYVKNTDYPKIVDFSRLPESFGNCRSLGDDTAGEFVIKTWAEKFIPENNAVSVGRGWGGDTWRIYAEGPEADSVLKESTDDKEAVSAEASEGNSIKSEAKSFVVWTSVWDSDFDAQEFAGFVKTALKDKAEIKSFDKLVTVLIDVPDELREEVIKSVTGNNIEIKNYKQ